MMTQAYLQLTRWCHSLLLEVEQPFSLVLGPSRGTLALLGLQLFLPFNLLSHLFNIPFVNFPFLKMLIQASSISFCSVYPRTQIITVLQIFELGFLQVLSSFDYEKEVDEKGFKDRLLCVWVSLYSKHQKLKTTGSLLLIFRCFFFT